MEVSSAFLHHTDPADRTDRWCSKQFADLVVDPVKWPYHLANFLSVCTELETLKLAFRNDWEDTGVVLERIASKVTLKTLKSLTLDYARVAGQDLAKLVCKPSNLRNLRLDNLDVVGEVPYSHVLMAISKQHKQLASFSCRQIAEDSKRLCFRNYYDMSCSSRQLGRDEADFFDDFAWVHCHKYEATIEAWENVPSRLALLAGDIEKSYISYHPEFEQRQIYQWYF